MPRWTTSAAELLADPSIDAVILALPANLRTTHVSLFDGSNEGLACSDRPAFSVQYHPEASPGPSDSHYLFQRFIGMIDRRA